MSVRYGIQSSAGSCVVPRALLRDSGSSSPHRGQAKLKASSCVSSKILARGSLNNMWPPMYVSSHKACCRRAWMRRRVSSYTVPGLKMRSMRSLGMSFEEIGLL